STLSPSFSFLSLFFFNDPATTEIYTLSLHDALPISCACTAACRCAGPNWATPRTSAARTTPGPTATTAGWPGCRSTRRPTAARRSEEHTSELQSRRDLVCRLLLEKKKKKN